MEIVDELFDVVEIEINSRCNLKCAYCPSAIQPATLPPKMDFDSFAKIIAQLAALQFSGRLSFHLYSEPLLHPALVRFVTLARKRLPDSDLVLYTNGTLLTNRKIAALSNAGIDFFWVTKHIRHPLPFTEKPDNMIVCDHTELELTNRCGYVRKLARPLEIPCFVPYDLLLISITGDVLLCFEDAYRSRVMGNIFRTPIQEIWFSRDYAHIRASLVRGHRGAEWPCRACDNTKNNMRGKLREN